MRVQRDCPTICSFLHGRVIRLDWWFVAPVSVARHVATHAHWRPQNCVAAANFGTQDLGSDDLQGLWQARAQPDVQSKIFSMNKDVHDMTRSCAEPGAFVEKDTFAGVGVYAQIRQASRVRRQQLRYLTIPLIQGNGRSVLDDQPCMQQDMGGKKMTCHAKDDAVLLYLVPSLSVPILSTTFDGCPKFSAPILLGYPDSWILARISDVDSRQAILRWALSEHKP